MADLYKRPSSPTGEAKEPHQGRVISLAERSVSQFPLGEEEERRGRKKEERSEGIEDAGKLPSGAGVCQQQAEPVHTVDKCGPA